MKEMNREEWSVEFCFLVENQGKNISCHGMGSNLTFLKWLDGLVRISKLTDMLLGNIYTSMYSLTLDCELIMYANLVIEIVALFLFNV